MNPHAMASELERLSAEFSTMSEEAGIIEMKRAVEWSELRATAKTNTEADHAYDSTPNGQRRIQLKFLMAASEKRMSALKASLRNAEIEYRHSN